MKAKVADLGPRILAAIIDVLIGWAFTVVPVIGALIGVFYLLFKDALPYQLFKTEDWKNKSIGKKVMDIQVSSLDGSDIDLALSAKRNIPLCLGNAIAIVPILGWVLGPIVGLILGVIEIIMVLTDKEKRQRLGDRIANTIIIGSEKNDPVSGDAPTEKATVSDNAAD